MREKIIGCKIDTGFGRSDRKVDDRFELSTREKPA